MAVTHKIASFDVVELTEAVGDAPAGARGGVLELRGEEKAIVEITEPSLDAASRIVFAPLAKLRVVGPAPRG